MGRVQSRCVSIKRSLLGRRCIRLRKRNMPLSRRIVAKRQSYAGRDSSHRRIETMRYRPEILRALPTCIARTRACRVRIMRNLRRGDMRMPGLPCVHAKQCFVLSLRIPCVGACSVPASGLFVVSEIRDPGTRSSMTGARTLRRRCCRHHHASGHRSRRTIAVARASGHTPRGCGVGLGVVSSAGCFVAVVVGRG